MLCGGSQCERTKKITAERDKPLTVIRRGYYAEYRDMSVGVSQIITIFAQPRPIIVNYYPFP